MLAVGLLAAQCLPLDLEGACILVGPQRPDQVVLPMHPYPHLAPPASPPCHPVVPATQDLMEDLPGPDPCIQVIQLFLCCNGLDNGSTLTQNGEVEDLGEVGATRLGHLLLQRVP